MSKSNKIGNFLRSPKAINYVIIPIVILVSIGLLYVYIFEPFTGENTTHSEFNENTNADLINTSTPVLTPEKKEQNILDIYKQSKEDSLNNARINSDISLSDGGTEKSKEDAFIADDFYEVDPQTRQLIKQLEEQEKLLDKKEGRTPSGSYMPAGTERVSAGGSSGGNNNDNNSKDSYMEKLMQGRADMLRRYEEMNKEKSGPGQVVPSRETPYVEFRASIYQDQYILPGDRVELVLTHDLRYGNKVFPKGTFIYAFAGMGPSRIFLDVDNIAHVPIRLEAKDITDGRLGIYSTRAGELWLQYQDELKNDSDKNIAAAAGDISGSTFLGSALRGLADFFKKKKITKRDKVLLISGHEVIFITKKE